MRFSTKGHYGLAVMLALARSYGEGPVALAEIARSENISLSYLEHLVAILRRAKLVEAKRGARGGYQLTADPSSITAGRVLRALEGPISVTECTSEKANHGHCEKEIACPSRPLWEHLRDSIASVLDSTTLDDLCHNYTTLESTPAGKEN